MRSTDAGTDGRGLRSRAGSRSIAALLATAAIAGAVLATGCGGSTSKSIGDTLTLADPTAPQSLDPAAGCGNCRDYLGLAYDPLIVWAADGSYKPGLAVSWKYGPRNQSFEMKLRSGVKFNDGEPLDAQAVKTWIEYTAAGGRGGAKYLVNLKTVEVVDPLTVNLTFSAPTPHLPLLLSQRTLLGFVASPKAVRAGTLGKTPVGAGPYVLDKSATVVGDSYTFVPNPTYWNKEAIHWKKVVINVVDNPNAALQALKVGEAQVASRQPPTSIAAAKRTDNLAYKSARSVMLPLLLLDRGGKLSKPLGDVRVRQALNYAVDRPAVAKVVGGGEGRPVTQMAAPGVESYDPALEKSYPYDPDKAKQMLADAGYPRGFKLRAVVEDIAGNKQAAQIIVGQLAAIGVTLDLDVKAGPAAIEAIASRKYPAAVTGMGGLQPATMQYDLFWGPKASAYNPFTSTDPQINSLQRQLLLAAGGSEEEAALSKKVQARLSELAWYVPVLVAPVTYIYRSDQVAGVEASERRTNTWVQDFRPAS